MIGSATMMESTRKRRKLAESIEDVSTTPTRRQTRKQKDWLNQLENDDSERASRSPRRRRTPKLGKSPGSSVELTGKKGSLIKPFDSDVEDCPEITPKSFYGGKRSRYLSPLERREAREMEEVRRKSISSEDEKEEKKSPKKTPNQNKTPKSKIIKSGSLNNKASNSKKMVIRNNKKMNGETMTSRVSPRKHPVSPRKTAVSPRKSPAEVPRVSPRKSPRKASQLNETPKKKLFNKSNGCSEETILRRSPRKSPRRSSPRKQPTNQSHGSPNFDSGIYFGKETSVKKSASKGIKLYMQTLNKNKKSLPPLSGKKKKSNTVNQRSPSLTPTRWTPKNNKKASEMPVKKTFTFTDEPQIEVMNEIKMVITENGNDTPNKIKTYMKPTKSPKTSLESPTTNRSPQKKPCDSLSTNGNPKKRTLSGTPGKSPKKMKSDNIEIAPPGTPTSDKDTQRKGVKMFPIFTSQSTSPSIEPKSKKTGTVSNSPRSSGSSRFSHSPKLRRSPILKKSRDKDGKEQMILDLGQKRFGATMCPTCGMVYSMAEPEDESDHIKFHTKFLECVKFPGWKKEHVVHEFHDGRIIMISPDDPKYAQKKVEDVRELVDSELGFLEGGIACKQNSKAFLFISTEKKVVGCCIAEKISKGYRVIADGEQADSMEDRKRAWCCSSEPVYAVCGISRIWVSGQTRRKKIATRLIDCLKSNFTYGCTLTNDEMAFSDPTPDGKIFATKYTGTPRFLVYNFTSH
ncbi:uncharacterized protein LOC144445857 [Glandiceps talaboti]